MRRAHLLDAVRRAIQQGTSLAVALRDMRNRAAVPPSVAVAITLSNRTSYTPDEELSFRHVRHYLGRYDTYVLMPRSHQGIYPGLMPKRFPDRCFRSARALGSLLLSARFYQAFLAYEFVLVHPLDSLVFSDCLPGWCSAGYDYIAPPRLVPQGTGTMDEKVSRAGLSLRRVRSFLDVLRSRAGRAQWDIEGNSWLTRTRRQLMRWIGPPTDGEQAVPNVRIAPDDVALRFAFEAEPRASFERIGRQMPFAAQRWHAEDRGFYEPSLLRHGLKSEVRLRPSREARAWGEFEIEMARMVRAVPR